MAISFELVSAAKTRVLLNVVEYALRLEKLARKAFPNEKRERDILKVFWGGMNIDIRTTVISAYPKNIKDAVDMARKAKILLSTRKLSINTVAMKDSPDVSHKSRQSSISPCRSKDRCTNERRREKYRDNSSSREHATARRETIET